MSKLTSVSILIIFSGLVGACSSPAAPSSVKATGSTTKLSGSTSTAGSNLMGINFNWGPTEDYSTDMVFADAMKSARIWCLPNSDSTAPVDSNFWPTQDAWLYIMAGKSQNDGTYQCQFTGQATVTEGYHGLAGSVQNVAYNAATNTTSFSVTITQSGGTFSLGFTNTKRT